MLADLQFRRSKGDSSIVDVSCQYVDTSDLPAIDNEVSAGQHFLRMHAHTPCMQPTTPGPTTQMQRIKYPKDNHIVLDLSYNELKLNDVTALVSMLTKYSQLDINVAHNRMDWDEVRSMAGGGETLLRQVSR